MNAPKKLTILASCPFCGCAAAYYGAAVRCTSFKCNAGLSPDWSTKTVRSVQGNPDERLCQAQAETAERWNRRASQAAPAPQDQQAEAVRPVNLLDRADDEAFEWVMKNLCAVRRDNGSMEYGLQAVIRAFQEGRAAPAPSDALRDIMAERLRQITAEGWTHCNDDAYQTGDLANAAACYAMTAPMMDRDRTAPAIWPWAASWWKPTNRRRDLIKAGALILAEIERLDRTAAPTEGKA